MHTTSISSDAARTLFTLKFYGSPQTMRRAVRKQWPESAKSIFHGVCFTDITTTKWVVSQIILAPCSETRKRGRETTLGVMLHECVHAANGCYTALRSLGRLKGVNQDEYIAYTTVGLYRYASSSLYHNFSVPDRDVGFADKHLSYACSKDNAIA